MLKSDGATDTVLDAIRAATVHPGAGNQPKSNYQKDDLQGAVSALHDAWNRNDLVVAGP